MTCIVLAEARSLDSFLDVLWKAQQDGVQSIPSYGQMRRGEKLVSGEIKLIGDGIATVCTAIEAGGKDVRMLAVSYGH